jgi:ribosomal protein L37AE/L43A
MKGARHPEAPRFCPSCGRDTPHQLRSCGGASVWICEGCVARALVSDGLARNPRSASASFGRGVKFAHRNSA